jgi:hypothetical protein
MIHTLQQILSWKYIMYRKGEKFIQIYSLKTETDGATCESDRAYMGR